MIETHGDVLVIEAAPALETMDPNLVDGAAALLLEPVRRLENPLILVDLTRCRYFGSTFLALLIRCWKVVTSKGGMMALCGASEAARELLHITSLDLVWPIYGDREEAMRALLSE